MAGSLNDELVNFLSNVNSLSSVRVLLMKENLLRLSCFENDGINTEVKIGEFLSERKEERYSKMTFDQIFRSNYDRLI